MTARRAWQWVLTIAILSMSGLSVLAAFQPTFGDWAGLAAVCLILTAIERLLSGLHARLDRLESGRTRPAWASRTKATPVITPLDPETATIPRVARHSAVPDCSCPFGYEGRIKHVYSCALGAYQRRQEYAKLVRLLDERQSG